MFLCVPARAARICALYVPYNETTDLMGELTARGIANLPIPTEQERQRDHKDGRVPGLILRVFSSGRRSWHLRYRADGTPRKFKIGDYPTLSLAAARREAESLRVEVRGGADPVRERVERKEADTLGDLIEWYLEEHARKKLAPITARENERILTSPDFSPLRKLAAMSVTDADVAKALDRIERRGAMTMVNRAQSALSAVYIGFDLVTAFVCGDLSNERVFRGQNHVGCTKEGIGARGEDLQLRFGLFVDREENPCTF